MVFSSIPVYLDPPNWQQQQNHHLGSGSNENQQSPHHLPPLPPQPPSHGGCGGSSGSIRPGSMAERARLAKIPQPEATLKCPRCDSSNTKFCYFNNYSLTQPRHFCKTCRRYWTRGGALRNVPVGGGCRRNKKNKSNNRSKSPSSTENRNKQNTSSSSNSLIPSNGNSSSTEMISHFPLPQTQPSFMASIQNLTRFGGGGNLGLNLSEIQAQTEMGFQIGGNSSGTNVLLPGGEADQWRLQQFPLLGGGHEYESSIGNLYPFQGTTTDHHQGVEVGNSSRVSQFLPPVKMEESQRLNLLRPSLGNISETNQYWGGASGGWADLSGLNSSSSTHLL
ncbi:hypothetical protein UlMin_013467 [Ulmus minor]